MGYYIGNMEFDPDYLEHYGVKGMKWGKHRTRGKIQDWWTGRDRVNNVDSLLKANSNLRANIQYFINKSTNERDKLVEKGAPVRAFQLLENKTLESLMPIDNQLDDNKKAIRKEMEKYRKAPRQVIAKTIRDGKTRVAYILNKIKSN